MICKISTRVLSSFVTECAVTGEISIGETDEVIIQCVTSTEVSKLESEGLCHSWSCLMLLDWTNV